MIRIDKHGHPYTFVTPEEEQEVLNKLELGTSALITEMISNAVKTANRKNTAVIKEENK